MKTLLLTVSSLIVFTPGFTQDQNKELKAQAQLSIQKSAEYFRSVGTDVGRNDVVMLLFILQEHFNQSFGLPSLEQYKQKDPELITSHFKLYDTYYDGKKIPMMADEAAKEYLKNNINTTDGMTAWSMYCNKYPLPENYLKLLEENAGLSDYDMTHAALHLANVLNGGCVKQSEVTQRIKEKLVKGLITQIHSNDEFKNKDDLKYECIAMLYYLGSDLVKDEYIKDIITSQLRNGGWEALKGSGTGANVHTSAMALWALLEYSSRN